MSKIPSLAQLTDQLQRLNHAAKKPDAHPGTAQQAAKTKVAIDFYHAFQRTCKGLKSRGEIISKDGLTTGLVQLPAGHYQAIAADVPWPYKLRVNDSTHRNRIPYKPMTIEQIQNLPIPDLADPDGCALWFWFTNNHAPEAMDLIRHWGFELKTIGTWMKTTKAGEPRMGVGHWLRNSTEHYALCTRGKLPSFSHTKTLHEHPYQSVIKAERRQHSRKPEEFYQLVNDLQPDANKLDLFTRQYRDGWTPWGDQSELFNLEEKELSQDG